MEQWNGGRTDPPAEADQAADVRSRQLRSTEAARSQLGLIPKRVWRSRVHLPASPKACQNPFIVINDTQAPLAMMAKRWRRVTLAAIML